MKTLNLYIGRQLVSTTAIALLVLTFVMLSANLMRAFELLARGLPGRVIGAFLLHLLPVMLTFTIPLAVLVACVQVFSRMSADNEITAMRAIGVGLWQIIAPGLIMSFALSLLCIYLHVELAPHSKLRADSLRHREAARNPLAFLEPGRFVELPGYIIYVGQRDQNELEDIHLYVLDSNQKVVQDIWARGGRVEVDEQQQQIQLMLHNAVITAVDAASPDRVQLQRLSTTETVLPIDYGSELAGKPLFKKPKHMDLKAILSTIYVYSERGVNVTPLYVELHTRLSLALAPLAFMLLGVPFGIRTRRTETSAGLVISLVLAMFFYIFIVIADNLNDHSAYHPEVLVWLPNIVYQIGGLCGLAYIAKQ